GGGRGRGGGAGSWVRGPLRRLRGGSQEASRRRSRAPASPPLQEAQDLIARATPDGLIRRCAGGTRRSAHFPPRGGHAACARSRSGGAASARGRRRRHGRGG